MKSSGGDPVLSAGGLKICDDLLMLGFERTDRQLLDAAALTGHLVLPSASHALCWSGTAGTPWRR